MRLKPHERLLLAICLCGALACAAIAPSRDSSPLGTPIPDGKLELVRGSSVSHTTPTYCDELFVNNQGAEGGHRGCINRPAGTICIMCAVTANKPTDGTPPPGYDLAQVNCNIGQNDKFIGGCDGNVSCTNLKPLNTNCTGNIDGNTPE
ncbi:MAG: hypothetical protein ACP5XB_08875 [Isosphaeraceae bacterium]